MKRCNLCGLEKDLESFPIHSKSKRHPRCKECRSAEQRQRYEETKESQLSRRKAETTKQIYNMTLEDFEALLVAQRGLCAICRDKLIKPCIDHCHITSRVRGILCGRCNTGLGMFRDNPDALRAAAMYVETADTGFVANHQALRKRWKK